MRVLPAGVTLLPVSLHDFQVVPGEGVEARVSVDGAATQLARLGNLAFAVSAGGRYGTPSHSILAHTTSFPLALVCAH